jgi:hypothetical protein
MRLVTYSKHASALLHRVLQQQLETPFDADRHAALVAEVYRQYPHSRLLAKAAVLIEKAGDNSDLAHPPAPCPSSLPGTRRFPGRG